MAGFLPIGKQVNPVKPGLALSSVFGQVGSDPACTARRRSRENRGLLLFSVFRGLGNHSWFFHGVGVMGKVHWSKYRRRSTGCAWLERLTYRFLFPQHFALEPPEPCPPLPTNFMGRAGCGLAQLCASHFWWFRASCRAVSRAGHTLASPSPASLARPPQIS